MKWIYEVVYRAGYSGSIYSRPEEWTVTRKKEGCSCCGHADHPVTLARFYDGDMAQHYVDQMNRLEATRA